MEIEEYTIPEKGKLVTKKEISIELQQWLNDNNLNDHRFIEITSPVGSVFYILGNQVYTHSFSVDNYKQSDISQSDIDKLNASVIFIFPDENNLRIYPLIDINQKNLMRSKKLERILR